MSNKLVAILLAPIASDAIQLSTSERRQPPMGGGMGGVSAGGMGGFMSCETKVQEGDCLSESTCGWKFQPAGDPFAKECVPWQMQGHTSCADWAASVAAPWQGKCGAGGGGGAAAAPAPGAAPAAPAAPTAAPAPAPAPTAAPVATVAPTAAPTAAPTPAPTTLPPTTTTTTTTPVFTMVVKTCDTQHAQSGAAVTIETDTVTFEQIFKRNDERSFSIPGALPTFVTFKHPSSDGLCIQSVDIEGKTFASSFWLDEPVEGGDSYPSDYGCVGAEKKIDFTKDFVSVTVKSCDKKWANSGGSVVIESSTGDSVTTKFKRNDVKSFQVVGIPDWVKFTHSSSDGLCIANVEVEGKSPYTSSFWLDKPCSGNGYPSEQGCVGAEKEIDFSKTYETLVVKSCDTKWAGSGGAVTIETSSGDSFTKKFGRDDQKSFQATAPVNWVKFTHNSKNGLCIGEVSVGNKSSTESFWLDKPCEKKGKYKQSSALGCAGGEKVVDFK